MSTMEDVVLSDVTSPEPESRVLIIMTGGTICMKKSPDGLIPARGFLKTAMQPRTEFNDHSNPGPIDVRANDDQDGVQQYESLRTPLSEYGKHIRLVAFAGQYDYSGGERRAWPLLTATGMRC